MGIFVARRSRRSGVSVTDDQNVWELKDSGGTPVAAFVVVPDAEGHVHVTLYPTAHTGREAHDPVVKAIGAKVDEIGLDASAIVWSEEDWPRETA
jgi:hypothetical protein